MLLKAGRAISYGLGPIFHEPYARRSFLSLDLGGLLDIEVTAMFASLGVEHLDLAGDATSKEGTCEITFGTATSGDDVLATE